MHYTKYWMALEQVQGMGPVHLKKIYESLSEKGLSVYDIFGLDREEMRKEFPFEDKIIDAVQEAEKNLDRVEKDYLALLDAGFDILVFYYEGYPERLLSILGSQFPPILYIYGNRALLKEKGAAILGDSNVSGRGELIAYLSARELTRHRIVTISGFARGTDLIAHRSALENGGSTIALLPYGMKHLTIPESLKPLFDESRILLATPFTPAREYSPYNALHRNKIIAALSYAVFIVEAPAEGGVFEAGKSAKNLNIPFYVTEYSQYPESASGNRRLIEEFKGIPVRGRMENNQLIPNLDRLIGDVKFA